MEAQMRHTLVVAVAGLLCMAAFAVAQDVAPPEKTGLKVGQKAPAFKLNDQTGKPRTLEDICNDVDYVALVFYRSASW